MITLEISKTDLEKLNYERFYYPSPLIQKRLHALYLEGQNRYSRSEIATILGIDRNSITRYVKTYNKYGYEGIITSNYRGNKSELEVHNITLIESFEKEPVKSVNEAKSRIEALTGISRSPSQVRAWMKRHELRYLKTGQVPSKADKLVQEHFLDKTLKPLIEQADKEQAHLLFMDAAHFVMGVFLTALWCFKRVFIKSSSGRKRYNVLGAVNAITHDIHVKTNCSYINALVIVDFLKELRSYYSDNKPIFIVLDNARYQHCKLVKAAAEPLNIQLVFLPPYSPNLNIIERFWKWTKKECLYAKYYETFDGFKTAIDNAIVNANTLKKSEIKSLLTLNFQFF